MTKVCSKCKIKKELSEFHKLKKAKDGLRYKCKICRKLEYNKNKDLILKQRKERYENDKIYREAKINYAREYQHTPQAKEQRKLGYEKNKEKILKRNRNYRKSKEYKSWRKDYEHNREKNDINYKLTKNLRRRLGIAVRGNQKTGSAVKDLGCSVGELKKQLESQFYPHPETGEMMTWDNWGMNYNSWQIDHIEELCAFDLSNRKQFLKACNHINLQPLWYCDHIRKGKKHG